jgi:hypothetical protein
VRISGPPLAAVAPLVAVQVALLAVFELAAHLWLTLALLLGGSLALAWALYRLRPPAAASARSILVLAALLRLLALPLPPTLSDDVWRYLWDGRLAAAGGNPYRDAPASPATEPLRDELWRRLPHRGVPTIYPPLAIAVFSIASRLPASPWALKAILAGADLAACALLVALAGRLNLPLARAVAYAWNPLVVLETAGMGHVDALGVLAALAAALALAARPPRVGPAAAAAAAGVLAKLLPVAALPLWARLSGRPARFAAAAVALVVLGFAPVLATSGGLPAGWRIYAISWEFNGPLFEPLWRLLAAAGAPGWAAGLLDRLKLLTGEHELWNRFYPYAYPQLLAKLVLGAGAAVAIAASLGETRLVGGSARLFGRLLLLSATVYPWYVLWVLPWAALEGASAWMLLAALLPLAYLAQPGGVDPFPWLQLAIWGPPLALVLWRRRRWSSG